MQTMFTNKCTKPNDGAKNQTKESELRCSFHGNASDAEHSIYVVMYENKSKSRTNAIVHWNRTNQREWSSEGEERTRWQKSQRAIEWAIEWTSEGENKQAQMWMKKTNEMEKRKQIETVTKKHGIVKNNTDTMNNKTMRNLRNLLNNFQSKRRWFNLISNSFIFHFAESNFGI